MGKRQGLTDEQKTKAMELRRKGFGYKTIGDKIGSTKDKVRNYMRSKSAQSIAKSMGFDLGTVARKNTSTKKVVKPKKYECRECSMVYHMRDSDIKSTVYCSSECKESYTECLAKKRRAERIKRNTRNCVGCGETYVANNGMQKYCSDECKLFELTCENCGISFRGWHENQRACGRSCGSILGRNSGLSRAQRVEAIKLRNEGRSYGEIAQATKVKRASNIRGFLKSEEAVRLGLKESKRPKKSGYKQDYESREKHFAEVFEELHPTFKYHSEYKNATEMFKCECLECGHVQERSANLVRPSRTDYNLQCDGCLEIERNEREKEREKERQRDMALRRLGRTLLRIEKIRKAKQDRIDYLTSLEGYVCPECGDTFTATFKGRKYCGDTCMKRVNDRTKKTRRRLRAEANGVVDAIALDKLIVRDGNECYLCNEECDRNDYITNGDGHFIAGRTYPSIDHVIPVAKGGTHTWDNVKLAHHYCNTIKSDNIIEEVLQMA